MNWVFISIGAYWYFFFNLIHFTLRFTNLNAFLWIHKIQDPTVLLIHSCAYINLFRQVILSFIPHLFIYSKVKNTLKDTDVFRTNSHLKHVWKEYTTTYYRDKSHVRVPEYKSHQSQIFDARPLIILDSYFTCLCSLSLCSCSCKGLGKTKSIVGTAFFFRRLHCFASPKFKTHWKQLCSKWTEHSTEMFVALKLGWCLRTNRSHCDLIVTSFRNKCIEMPSVYVVFLQLTKPGPPATQNFPLLHFFPSVAMMAGRFYTP